ncbi:hypothetical protein [Plantibacter sp. YIM 135249]|jgi:hypothetical protein|uniref:hypothetical protein n=1 Tax=Plantibacter sp. YIM 135249 TaxID=3423918 RepID=UPI003D338DC3
MRGRLTARGVRWWGIGLLAVAVLVGLTAPDVHFWLNGAPGTGDQAQLDVLFAVLTVVGELVLPLGIGLVSASIVMSYADRRAGTPAR